MISASVHNLGRVTVSETTKGSVPFVTEEFFYEEPQIFGYIGLDAQTGQRHNNYDQFLRSNIDNEQDQRNFNVDEGKDHLPFRTVDGTQRNRYVTGRWDNTNDRVNIPDLTAKNVYDVDTPYLIPLRWNNPHASELEVNIWILNHGNDHPVVVPIRKPTCSGEGYQDNIVGFTIPKDFTKLGSKIPGFKGCKATGDCVLQVYSHSVESRTYAFAVGVIVNGHEDGLTTDTTAGIMPWAQDPWFDLAQLRDLCLWTTSGLADITSSKPRWARLVSDVFNHAYQDSDFSPYSGQQHESISKNLQASCLLKGVTGDRGELGQEILSQKTLQGNLKDSADETYKRYEKLANKIINAVGSKMMSTGNVGAQDLNACFRCAAVGATSSNRIETNTYIPSFKVPTDLVEEVKAMIPSRYSGLMSSTNNIQIYVAALKDMMPSFVAAAEKGIIFQPAREKFTLTTLVDATEYLKKDASGTLDNGVYAATQAKLTYATELGCDPKCLQCTAGSGKMGVSLYIGSEGTCLNHCSQGSVCEAAAASGGVDCTSCDYFYGMGDAVIQKGEHAGEATPSTGVAALAEMSACDFDGTCADADGDDEDECDGNVACQVVAETGALVNPDNGEEDLPLKTVVKYPNNGKYPKNVQEYNSDGGDGGTNNGGNDGNDGNGGSTAGTKDTTPDLDSGSAAPTVALSAMLSTLVLVWLRALC